MATTRQLPRRDQVPVEQTWDAGAVYPSDEAWEEALRAANAEVPRLARYRGRLGESAATLLEALRTRDEWQALIWRIRWHAAMRVKVDATDRRASAQHERALGLIARVGEALAYLDPELLARFELACHEHLERGDGLSADWLGALMVDLLGQAHGPAVTLDPARDGVLWAHVPHLYLNYYTYQLRAGAGGGDGVGGWRAPGGGAGRDALHRVPESGRLGVSAGCLAARGR